MSEAGQIPVPRIIEGGLAIDDRGFTAFVNGFHFEGVKRFYMISNHRAGFIRAWHAHRREAKYVTCAQGSAIVAAVAIDDWEHPSKSAQVYRFAMSAAKPAVLYIPPGYANGLMSLTAGAKLVVFSTSTLEESQGDDVRFDSRYWDPWQVIER
ncbi:MAG: dTDP-4-dehydrorhamnose 3,5-epimerase family protein [Chloroflexi bacterium]|nr:dTDP-4-dehydrorhamnose 3,5-epimerase family protein [Chloroflexota bacterium]